MFDALHISMMITANKKINWDYRLYTETVRACGVIHKVWNLDLIANGIRIKSIQGLNRDTVLKKGMEIVSLLKK